MDKLEKAHDEYTTRIIRKIIAFPLAKFLVKYSNITPTQVTLCGIVLGVIGIINLLLGNILMGSLFCFLYLVFDCVDGTVARLTKKTSKFGEWFDGVAGYVLVPSIFLATGIGLKSYSAMLVSSIAAVNFPLQFSIIHFYKSEIVHNNARIKLTPSGRFDFFKYFYGASLPFPLLLVGALLDKTIYVLYFFAVYGFFFVAAIIIFQSLSFKGKKNNVVFFVQDYRPRYEAISKEIYNLKNYLKERGWAVKIHSLNSKFKFKISPELISYPFILYPFTLPFVYFYSLFFRVRHIYTSLADKPYLSIINKPPLLVTSSAPFDDGACDEKKLSKVTKKIVEDPGLLIDHNTVLIYPGIDLNKFKYKKPNKGKFTVLFASNPAKESMFGPRGIYLLLSVAKEVENSVNFRFSWRTNNNYKEIVKMVRGHSNIYVTNKIVEDMDEVYGEAHCVIIPYTSDKVVKSIPHSAIESLAAGKPVLCSSKSGIARLISHHKVGVVFDPSKESLLLAITEMMRNYKLYQENCRKISEELFSLEIFEKNYGDIYQGFEKNSHKDEL